ILLPLKGKSKVDVVRMGLELGVPLGHTWSCYWDRDVHCGTCASCIERKDAFRVLGVEDPITYESIK
ncbi:MAG: 7-cyano-7-deazaguanine synthase, partial [Candidatus Thermoplasmatota archaeon]